MVLMLISLITNTFKHLKIWLVLILLIKILPKSFAHFSSRLSFLHWCLGILCMSLKFLVDHKCWKYLLPVSNCWSLLRNRRSFCFFFILVGVVEFLLKAFQDLPFINAPKSLYILHLVLYTVWEVIQFCVCFPHG